MKLNWVRRLSALLISLFIFASAIPAKAESLFPKEEVVYATLENDGAAGGASVVNIFTLSSDGQVSDYGDYASVTNLTNQNPLQFSSGTSTVDALKGRFFYQGELAKAVLPWNFDIQYSFDYQTIDPESLAGKSGALGLRIHSAQNEAANASFYENYMLQLSVTLDSNKCMNLKAEGGAIANSGSDKLITFTVMPGKDADCVLTADVIDFSMPGISINAIPLSFSIDRPDTSEMTGDLKKLTDAISELRDGTLELKKGVVSLQDGVETLADGSAQLRAGTDALPAGDQKLSQASSGINQTLKGLKTQTGEPDDLASKDMYQTIQGMQTALTSLGSKYAGDPDVNALNSALNDFQSHYRLLVNLCMVVSGTVDTTGQLHPGLADQYDSYNRQLQGLLTSLDSLSSSYAAIDGGIQQLNSNLQKLTEGMGELSDGTKTLSDETSDMDGMIDEKIDELMAQYDKSDFIPVSFVSEKNTSVTSVQFVLKTKGIEKAEPEEEAPAAEENPGFFDRLLALFGL